MAALETGMKNFEYVAKPAIARLADLRNQGLHQILGNLMQHGLVAYERTKSYEGYRLTWKGYDYLALHTFMKRGLIDAVGPRIGVGKEADVHIVCLKGKSYAMKIHRLGRTSFRAVTKNRDYLRKGQFRNGWLHLSAVSALKEYQYLRALSTNGIPVPEVVDYNRHCILMTYVDGYILNKYKELPLRLSASAKGDEENSSNVEDLYETIMNLLVRLLRSGVVHGDFNEFNLMLTRRTLDLVLIDCPQVLPVSHPSARELFERDVQCIRTFFEKRFNYIGSKSPCFEDIVTEQVLTIAKKFAAVFTKGRTILDLREVETELYGGIASDDQYSSENGDNQSHIDEDETSLLHNTDNDEGDDDDDDESHSMNINHAVVDTEHDEDGNNRDDDVDSKTPSIDRAAQLEVVETSAL